MSLYFNTQRNNSEGNYRHIGDPDMDKVAPNRAHWERDDYDPLRLTGKGTGVHPVPVYKFETIAFPELQKLQRRADSRHQVLENRRHDRFNHTHSDFFTDRALN